MRDHAGLCDHHQNLGGAAEYALASDGGGQCVGRGHSILKGNDRRPRAKQLHARLGRGSIVVALDRDDGHVDRTDGLRVVSRLGRMNVRVAQRAFDLRSIAANGVQMLAAGEKGDAFPRRRQPRAEVAADLLVPTMAIRTSILLCSWVEGPVPRDRAVQSTRGVSSRAIGLIFAPNDGT